MLKFTMHVEGLDALKSKLASSGTRVEHAVALQVAKDTSPYVPMKTGVLDNTTRVDGNKVIYSTPYARYLYEGKVMVDAKTGKGPMRIVDENGNEYIRFRKGATLKPTSRDLDISTAVHPKATSHWLEASKAQNLEKWEEFAAKEQLRELKNG